MRALITLPFVLAVLAVLTVGGVLCLVQSTQQEQPDGVRPDGVEVPDELLDELLDEVSADYLEDELTNRVLGAIHVQLRREAGPEAGEVRVHVTARADGPNVDPIPGYRGVRGGNHITARELEKLLETGRLKIVTQTAHDNTKHFGTCTPGRRGRIPERRVDENGTLLLNTLSERDYLLEVRARSIPLPAGEHATYLEVNGVPRLCVHTVLGDGNNSGRIVSVESLGGHDLKR